MNSPRLTLPRAEADAIIAEAHATYPRECCGLIASQDGRAVKHYPITNVYPGDDFFEMEPAEQWAALNEIWFGDDGWELLVLYHSHPVSVAYPSARDIAVACNGEAGAASYPDTFYVICSLEHPEAPVLRAFLIRDGGEVTEAEVAIIDG